MQLFKMASVASSNKFIEVTNFVKKKKKETNKFISFKDVGR